PAPHDHAPGGAKKMKLAFVAAFLTSTIASADPVTLQDVLDDDDPAGAPGENAEQPAPDQDQAQPGTETKARMATGTQQRTIRTRVHDDGESPLEKVEDEVAGG